MAEAVLSESFGCERCCPPDAEAAFRARAELSTVADLIEESHYYVTVYACSVCAQRFVSVFTETIDWETGDDPQSWTLLPITEHEATRLLAERDALSGWTLNALGPTRRSLRHSSPNQTYWGSGLWVGMHD
jgi:hypothetical protein